MSDEQAPNWRSLARAAKTDTPAWDLWASLRRALSINNYEDAIVALLALATVEGVHTHNPHTGLAFLDLALAIANKTSSPVKAEIQYHRSTLLSASGDLAGAYLALDDALASAKAAGDLKSITRLANLRLALKLAGAQLEGSFLAEAREVVRAYAEAHDVNGQLGAMVASAALGAQAYPSEALSLLDQAEAFLNALDQGQVVAPPRSVLIRLPLSAGQAHENPAGESALDSWRLYIRQLREWIGKIRSTS